MAVAVVQRRRRRRSIWIYYLYYNWSVLLIGDVRTCTVVEKKRETDHQ